MRALKPLVCGFMLLPLGSSLANAQRLRAGVELGLSSSRLMDHFISDSNRHGVAAGLIVELGLAEQLSVETGASWVNKGGKGTIQGFEEAILVDVRLTYVQVPVMLRLSPWNTRLRPSLAAGGAIAFETACQNRSPQFAPAVLIDCDRSDNRSTDFSLLAAGGLTYNLGRTSILIEGRYDHGFRDLDEIDGIETSNRSFSVVGRLSVPVHR